MNQCPYELPTRFHKVDSKGCRHNHHYNTSQKGRFVPRQLTDLPGRKLCEAVADTTVALHQSRPLQLRRDDIVVELRLYVVPLQPVAMVVVETSRCIDCCKTISHHPCDAYEAVNHVPSDPIQCHLVSRHCPFDQTNLATACFCCQA